VSSLQEAAAKAGTITALTEEQLQTVREGLAAKAASAQQAKANSAAADATLRRLNEEDRTRWCEVNIPACALGVIPVK
jgi:hypothetical protein